APPVDRGARGARAHARRGADVRARAGRHDAPADPAGRVTFRRHGELSALRLDVARLRAPRARRRAAAGRRGGRGGRDEPARDEGRAVAASGRRPAVRVPQRSLAIVSAATSPSTSAVASPLAYPPFEIPPASTPAA